MLFQTTEAHETLRQQIRAFAEKKSSPLPSASTSKMPFPRKSSAKWARTAGWASPYDVEYGGAGLDVISYAIAVEELSRVDGGTGVILSAHTSLGPIPSRPSAARRKGKIPADLLNGKNSAPSA